MPDLTEQELEQLAGWQEQELALAREESQRSDPVIKNVGYRHFLSRTKGRGRPRRKWAEVELIRYQTGWHIPKRAKLDEIADELVGELMTDDQLYWYIQKHCQPNAGLMKAGGIA